MTPEIGEAAYKYNASIVDTPCIYVDMSTVNETTTSNDSSEHEADGIVFQIVNGQKEFAAGTKYANRCILM